MTKSNGEDPRSGTRMERFQQGVRQRSITAKKKVQNITKDDVKGCFKRNGFVMFTIIAVIVGIILGFSVRSYKMTYREIKYFSFPGELLMRMLQMLVLPLIVSSLVTALNNKKNKAAVPDLAYKQEWCSSRPQTTCDPENRTSPENKT
ncbi:excitatory amino acid transporter 1 isoform X3 [Dendropsophus ebraccatus]|uniref:excitatory amino acid transporter 1 isoform X3 n=1 Tax=Dendropsophus ebraccatus TaxID=150705 RepID=UPI00383214F9